MLYCIYDVISVQFFLSFNVHHFHWRSSDLYWTHINEISPTPLVAIFISFHLS